MERKKVLVYPCGTEVALEVYRSLCYSTHYELIGGSDHYDHGRFVYRNLINGLPFIHDGSGGEEILRFEKAIADYGIDFIYPAMDGVIAVFAKYRHLLKETLVAADTETAQLCRSKKAMYTRLKGLVDIPAVYGTPYEVKEFPVFVKPDQGQGSAGAGRIDNMEALKKVDFDKNVIMEYLPGEEYTVDCFTNAAGSLIYSRARGRKRIKNGISVNAVFDDRPCFREIALKINRAVRQKGGWFFQLREGADGTLKLLEVAARIAGASALSRNAGANLPLMTMDVFHGIPIEDVALNRYPMELDRALGNAFRQDISYASVYVDYDDTIVQNGRINTTVIKFLYQCVNHKIAIILLSKHDGELAEELKKYKLQELFDQVLHIGREENKKDFIKDTDSIFIDDSYMERKAVKTAFGIPVFDTHMVECLLED